MKIFNFLSNNEAKAFASDFFTNYNDIMPCTNPSLEEFGKLIQNPETGKEAKPVLPAVMGQHQAMAFPQIHRFKAAANITVISPDLLFH